MTTQLTVSFFLLMVLQQISTEYVTIKPELNTHHNMAEAAFDELTLKINQAVYVAKFQIKAIIPQNTYYIYIRNIITNNLTQNYQDIFNAQLSAKNLGKTRSNCDGIKEEFSNMQNAAVDVALECLKKTFTNLLKDAYKSAEADLDAFLEEVANLGNELKNCNEDTCSDLIMFHVNEFRSKTKDIADIVQKYKDRIAPLKNQQQFCIDIVLQEAVIEGKKLVEKAKKCYS